jgi:hypothetical protein
LLRFAGGEGVLRFAFGLLACLLRMQACKRSEAKKEGGFGFRLLLAFYIGLRPI